MAIISHDKPLRALIWCAVSTPEQAADEKESLPAQERDLRAIAQQNGYEVIGVLRVPGFSRDYLSVEEWMADSTAAKEPILAPRQLLYDYMDYPKHRFPKFDVFLCRDADRFGRTQSLLTYIAEAILVKMNQFIHTQHDGLIDRPKARMFISMAGYRAAGAIDDFKAKRKFGIAKRAQRGLPVSSRIPMSHKLVRDPQSGRALCLEVDESKRRLWNDLATVILDGVAWFRIEQALYERFGHANEKGKVYYPNFFYKLIMKPLFWGHIAQHHNSTDVPNGFKLGRWVYDEAISLPQGVQMYRNTHAPVWTGETAEQIKAELVRRSDVVRGSARGWTTHRFSGLTICAECGSILSTVVNSTSNYRGMICKSASSNRPGLPACGNGKVINEKKLIAYFDALLRRFVEDRLSPFLEDDTSASRSLAQKLDTLAEDVTRAENQIGVLIREQSTASETVQPFYRTEVERMTQQLWHMKQAHTELQQKTAAVQRSNASQQAAREELMQLSVDQFWQQDSRSINQMLHRLMDKRRLVIQAGQIVGFVERPYRNRRTATTSLVYQE